jgi:hypothetical protein
MLNHCALAIVARWGNKPVIPAGQGALFLS